MSKAWNITYWISTILLTLGTLPALYFGFSGNPMGVEVFTGLGYPAYFAMIITVAKLLGLIGIWQNNVTFLREWAYAGFAFDTLGAAISILAVGGAFSGALPALATFVIVIISYTAFRKTGRAA